MQVLEAIFNRRSVRKFTEEPVSTADIHILMEAAMAAPSAMNRQPWEFVVITEADQLKALRHKLRLGRYEAPLGIVVCGNMRRTVPGPPRDFWIQDVSAAAENILLTAVELGLGGVWIGVHPIGLFSKGVSEVLDLPKHIEPLGLLWLGHPAESPEPRTQYKEEYVHWQRYKGQVDVDDTPEI